MGRLQSYTVTKHLADGGVTIGQEVNQKNNLLSQPEAYTSAVPKLQGVTANQDYVYMSASFGSHNSLIVRYERHGDSLDQPIYVVLPPYLEQISFDGNNLYAVFESATPKYRRRAKVVVDRLLVMTPTEFEQYAKPYKQ